jgi:hypothetical protein
MNHIDEKLIELINAGIDNELSAADRHQLEAQLVANPDARAMHQELQYLADTLDPLGDLVPPAEIRENILNTVSPTASSITLRLIAALLPSTAIPRYAMAFVGGLAFGALALQLGEGYRSDMDPSQFVGTMTNYGALPHAITADNISMDMEQINGGVRLHQISSMLVLEFNLNSARAVKVVTEFQGQAVEFKGLSLLENKLSTFVADQQSVSLAASGAHRYSVFLENTQKSETRINIKFFTDGELFHQETLQAPAVN